MHRYLINFRKSVSERKAEVSAKAYNHYRRLQPIVGKWYNPIKQIHNKYLGKFYGKGKTR
jgi:hypothetical protein